MSNKYDDIINLPHHESKTHPHMSLRDRAAQFSPFAALSGYEAAVNETARLTEEWVEPDEYKKEQLNRRLVLIGENLSQTPRVEITYFKPDEKKSGGAYVTARGSVRKIDTYEGIFYMADGTKIPVDALCMVEGEIFDKPL